MLNHNNNLAANGYVITVSGGLIFQKSVSGSPEYSGNPEGRLGKNVPPCLSGKVKRSYLFIALFEGFFHAAIYFAYATPRLLKYTG